VNSNPQTFSAFAIPVVLILVTAVTRKIVRGKSPFQWADWYLGLDLTLAAFSSAAVNILELNARGRENLAWYLVLAFIVFILQIAIHQEWVDPPRVSHAPLVSRRKQAILLGLLANTIGVSLLGFFIYWKIEGKL
jgi:hypothetical protein